MITAHLLLFLIEGAAKPAAELGISLANIRLRVYDASRPTRALVLHVRVVLADHLVQEVIVYQVALAVGVLLVGSDSRRDVVALEADR